MNTEENNQAASADASKDAGEGQSDTVTVSKQEYDKLNQDYGSLKRDYKDLKKSTEESKEPKETPKKTDKADDSRLLERVEKLALRTANVSHSDDIELARNTAKKWGMDLEDVLQDDDFKVKLEKQQTARNNLAATSGIKGSGSGGQAKMTPEYWIAKGTPPSPTDVPDRKARAKIARAMMSNSKQGKQFYNS